MDEINHSSSDHEEEEEEQSDYKVERSNLSDEQPPPPKRRSCETLDRISALPDSMLLHILSLLPMNEVVKTATLSKRWQYLWTCVPDLIFSGPIFEKHCICRFVSFVDRTLIQCRHSKIDKFTINFGYEPRFASHVNRWIRFATSCDVEELDINVHAMRHVRRYTLPKHLFTSSSLTKLGFWFCNVAPAGAISWKSLKNLSIWSVKLSEEVIQNILSGSPALEFLKLGFCRGFNLLDITSASVRKFVMDTYFDPMNEEDDSVLTISAPYLQSLHVDGGWHMKKFQLMNMSSLVDVNLSFHLNPDEENENMLNELLQALSDVNELTIGRYWCLQAMSKLELKGLPSPVSKWKCLKIVAPIFEWNLPGIENLLQSSPNLETLIIDGAGTDFEWEWTYGKRTFKCLQLHLKTLKIKISGSGGWDSGRELPFIRFLLENALVLEKMIVYMQLGPDGNQNLLRVAKKVLYYPRSSPNAVVMFRVCRVK